MEDLLLTEEERKVKYEVRNIVKDVPPELIRDIESEKVKFPREFLDLVAGAGIVGLRYPKKYGGRDASWVADMSAVEEMGRLGFTLSCMYSLGTIVGEAINRFGTPEQKETYLRGITSGKRYGAEAITEPSGGSDLFGMMKTAARREGDTFVLNGQKRFIVGGQGADFFVTYAVTDPSATPRTRGVSAFIVDRDTPGLRVETMYGLMGNKGGGTARIVFKDAVVPENHLIGEVNQGYDVFNRMMVPERLTTASGSLGVANAAIEVAAQYAMHREAFGAKLMEHEGVSFRIAESLTGIAHASALVYTASRAADALDAGKASPSYVRKLVSMAKLNSTEVMWNAVNSAMQVLGGIGYTTVYPVERLLRDSRLGMIWTGTNEIMKLIIQHEYVKEISSPEYPRDKRNIELDALDFSLVDEKVMS
ncbi:MAG: acyl-CoA/acyl-ACP dehydrogenase [Nitrososphaerota archaeon]|nr:acyl-CoA/acyl-ACP dehydrogenase [Nitrososphaerota archaeon]MDG7013686.1 acyl-CoA/acyl-ACP dehydrogenase [Nitrososphaerota archaeon]MDG7025958.1 acyl-CoA/acyl-ACP dehydrogenase [Nitrososphaerota archaeon]